MEKVLGFLGASAVGAAGWWAGERVGFMTAFLLSTVGSGIGLYYGRRLAREYLD
ncbi:MAG TPA: hypothetical protein VKA25_02290 [Gemmatimonadales bacterium]|nr:hypothetical protein [Gemmatimonadales bacterium]